MQLVASSPLSCIDMICYDDGDTDLVGQVPLVECRYDEVAALVSDISVARGTLNSSFLPCSSLRRACGNGG
jgi:hypothetical protein